MSRETAQPPTLSARDPMPGWHARLDDPFGISWRVTNLARRTSPRRSARFAWGLVRGVRHERPVFVLGCPRSGTTLLFELLRASTALGALPGEGHDVWRTFHHPRWSRWRSDRVGANEVRPCERRVVAARMYAHFGERRFVEKTPENSLRVPYLLRLFPDARFIVVHRDPCEVIGSIINGWRHPAGKYRSYFVPETLNIPAYSHPRRWCFALIDGWRDYRARPLHEIAFAQWEQCTTALAEARSLVRPSAWTELHLEDILSAPEEALERVCSAAEIDPEEKLAATLQDLIANPVNAMAAPGREKWRRGNRAEIEAVLPQIAAVAPRAGYVVDAVTGTVDRARTAR